MNFNNHSEDLNGELIDGAARNAQYPDGFDVPTDLEKRAVKVGDLVKIGVELDVPDGETTLGGERFWLRVTAVTRDGVFVGEVVDALLVVNGEPGNLIRFEARHMLDITQAIEVQG